MWVTIMERIFFLFRKGCWVSTLSQGDKLMINWALKYFCSSSCFSSSSFFAINLFIWLPVILLTFKLGLASRPDVTSWALLVCLCRTPASDLMRPACIISILNSIETVTHRAMTATFGVFPDFFFFSSLMRIIKSATESWKCDLVFLLLGSLAVCNYTFKMHTATYCVGVHSTSSISWLFVKKK